MIVKSINEKSSFGVFCLRDAHLLSTCVQLRPGKFQDQLENTTLRRWEVAVVARVNFGLPFYLSDLPVPEKRRSLALRHSSFISSAARLLSSIEIWIIQSVLEWNGENHSVNLGRPGSGVETDEISVRLI
jgi:hypothetical protein